MELECLAKVGIEDVTMVVARVSAVPRLLPCGKGTDGQDGAIVKFGRAA